MFDIDVTGILPHLGLSVKEKAEAVLALLRDLIAKRSAAYAELWDLVGDICPPKLMAGVLHPADGLTRADIQRIATGIDTWYRKNGSIQDSFSRLWLVALREELFCWLSLHRRADKSLNWHDDTDKGKGIPKCSTALRIWLIKTALRITLTQESSSTDVSQKRGNDAEWMKVSTDEIRPKLIRNYRVVKQAWQRFDKLNLPDEDQIAQVVDKLLKITVVRTSARGGAK